MNNKLIDIATTEYIYHSDGKVTVYFKNHLTNICQQKTYSNFRIASAQSTKFHNRIARVYTNSIYGV